MTYYDDGWEELQAEEARELELRVAEEKLENMVRAHLLADGDIIFCYDKYFEYEDEIFYEVIKAERFNRELGIYTDKWVRTGESYDMEEYNRYVKERTDSASN